MCECRIVWGCIFLRLKRGRDREVVLGYGVRMNHMITMELTEFILFTYVIPFYINVS